MALSANRDLDHYVDQQLHSFAASDEHIFKGSLLSFEPTNGYVHPLIATELFAGIAYKECDNSEGQSGDKNVQTFVQGDFNHALSGVALDDIGSAVYASADDTLTFVSTGNTFVGYMTGRVSTGVISLRIAPFQTPP